MSFLSNRWTLITCLFLIATTLFAYLGVSHHEFIKLDDQFYVTDNFHVTSGLSQKNALWAFTTFDGSNWHPLTWLSHMLDCQLFGLNGGLHHLSNLFFHILNTLLLFLVMYKMTTALWRSAFVAALFALHPLHVESVAWISERKDVLSTFFWLLTMWAYILYVNRPGFYKYLLLCLLFAMGLMAKPMLVTLPFVLLLMDYWPLSRIMRSPFGEVNYSHIVRHDLPELLWEKLPLFILTAASSVVTYLAQQAGGSVIPLERIPLSLRIANAVVSYVKYILKLIWPHNLAAYYPYPLSFNVWITFLFVLILLSLTAAVIRGWRRYPFLAFGWLWYLGTLVPVIGFIQVGSQSMADRYTYIPMIGLFIMIAWGLHGFFIRLKRGKYLYGLTATVILVFFMISTKNQVVYWENNYTLFRHTADVTDRNFVAHFHLGNEMDRQGKLEEAVSHYSMALHFHPNYAQVHNNLGVIFANQAQPDRALDHYREALRIRPDYAKAHDNLGILLARQGKFDEAVKHYHEAIRIESRNAKTHYNLGIALSRKGNTEHAIESFEKAIQINPDYIKAYFHLGEAYAQQRKMDKALEHYHKATQINPEFFPAHFRMADVLAGKGELEKAIKNYKLVLNLKPDFAPALNGLAWIYATHKDPRYRNAEEAVRLARKACDLTKNQHPGFLDTLAAAYAESGEFEKAQQIARNALDLAMKAEQGDTAEEIEMRLLLYREGRAFRDN